MLLAVVYSLQTLTSRGLYVGERPTKVVMSATRALMPGAQPATRTNIGAWGKRSRALQIRVRVARKRSSISSRALCRRDTLGLVKRVPETGHEPAMCGRLNVAQMPF